MPKPQCPSPVSVHFLSWLPVAGRQATRTAPARRTDDQEEGDFRAGKKVATVENEAKRG